MASDREPEPDVQAAFRADARARALCVICQRRRAAKGNRWRCRACTGKAMQSAMQWKHVEGCYVNGDLVQAPLVYSGPYTISCRTDWYSVSFRPTGEHHSVGNFPTLETAQDAARRHAEGALPARKIWPPDEASWRMVLGDKRSSQARKARVKRSRQRELELDIEDFAK